MIQVALAGYQLLCESKTLPDLFNLYVQNATLLDDFNVRGNEGVPCFIAVQPYGAPLPTLVIAQRYNPVLLPGVLFVPETHILFVGAGERLLAYDLTQPLRLWEDYTNIGFWSWERHSDFIIMAAELELAIWNINGDKLYSTFVEPPWSYSIKDDWVHVDVMGKQSSFPISQLNKAGR